MLRPSLVMTDITSASHDITSMRVRGFEICMVGEEEMVLTVNEGLERRADGRHPPTFRLIGGGAGRVESRRPETRMEQLTSPT
jgi:hypothetical protein